MDPFEVVGRVGGCRIDIPADPTVLDWRPFSLAGVSIEWKAKLVLLFSAGSGWTHDLLVEQVPSSVLVVLASLDCLSPNVSDSNLHFRRERGPFVAGSVIPFVTSSGESVELSDGSSSLVVVLLQVARFLYRRR